MFELVVFIMIISLCLFIMILLRIGGRLSLFSVGIFVLMVCSIMLVWFCCMNVDMWKCFVFGVVMVKLYFELFLYLCSCFLFMIDLIRLMVCWVFSGCCEIGVILLFILIVGGNFVVMNKFELWLFIINCKSLWMYLVVVLWFSMVCFF